MMKIASTGQVLHRLLHLHSTPLPLKRLANHGMMQL
jgi:hypothetical protein